MKKIFLILLVIILTLMIVLSVMYAYAVSRTKENYVNYFNQCKEEMSQFPTPYWDSIPGVRECLDKGGCFKMCGSCVSVKPTITLVEFFDELIKSYTGGYTLCPAVCQPGCLFPIKEP